MEEKYLEKESKTIIYKFSLKNQQGSVNIYFVDSVFEKVLYQFEGANVAYYKREDWKALKEIEEKICKIEDTIRFECEKKMFVEQKPY